MKELRFVGNALSKSLIDRNLVKNSFHKRALITSELKVSERTIFFSQSTNETCERLFLIIQEK